MRGLPPLLVALRPRQWTKNLIAFAAPLFAFRIDVATVSAGLLAFAVLCSVSSGFYLINDIADVKSDRRHPVKRRRPLASGALSLPLAAASAAVLLALALAAGWAHSRGLGATVSAYALLQLFYNLAFRRVVLLDVMAIAAGFVLRACAGAAAAGLVASPWFLICTALLALFLAIEKRKAELRLVSRAGGGTRSVLESYSLPLLSRMENAVAAGAIVAYALWSSGPQVNGAPTPWMLLTIPFVLYGVFRYQLVSTPREADAAGRSGAEAGEPGERPEEVLLTDVPTLLNTAAWAAVSFVILLLRSRGHIQ